MKLKIILLTTWLCALSFTAYAEPVKLSIEKADKLLSGLLALDGYEKVVKDGGSERPVKVVYDLSGRLRLLIAKDIDVLSPAIRRFSKTRQELVGAASVATHKIPVEGTPEFVKLSKDVQDMLDSEEQFDLLKIKEEELKLDANPISASVLSQLSPVLIQ